MHYSAGTEAAMLIKKSNNLTPLERERAIKFYTSHYRRAEKIIRRAGRNPLHIRAAAADKILKAAGASQRPIRAVSGGDQAEGVYQVGGEVWFNLSGLHGRLSMGN